MKALFRSVETTWRYEMRPSPSGLPTAGHPRFVCAVALAALSACTGVQRLPAEADTFRPADEAVAIADPRHVLGAWDVVSFEGYSPESRLIGAERAAYADFDVSGVALHLECNYTTRPDILGLGILDTGPDFDHPQTMMGCGADTNAREARYFRFFDRSPSIEALGAHRLLLKAGERTLILERPEIRRLAFVPTPRALTGTWQAESITRYVHGAGASSTGLSELPGHLIFDNGTLRHTTCSALRISYRIDNTGRLTTTGDSQRALAAHCADLHIPSSANGQPSAGDVIAVLHASPLAELSGKNGLLLSTDTFGLLLRRRD
ncbi:hypothetical protein [Luteimonas deserti]|uniref:META domain-containing protein n=1 Tax=Luteimonas deserti TaxID=2752306 RepID=A0A7Z0QPW7_9GAMM|nr:hypothetical protein [Luteimonas deserti]NYZ61560.1 hypothetical protein [Luteimonas deserti]